MDLRKAWIIALRDLRLVYSNRTTLLILFAAPIVLTAIIGAAFSKLAGNDVPITNIPIGIVDQDKGTSIIGQQINYGQYITDALIPQGAPDPNNTLQKLISAQKIDTLEQAKALVDQGKLAAAIIIPSDFSASLNPVQVAPKQTTITLYEDAGSPISASIAASAVRSVTNSVVSGDLAVFAAKDAGLLTQLATIDQQVSQKTQSAPPITINSLTVGQSQTTQSNSNALAYFAPAISVFFITFTAAAGATRIVEESEAGTLQRMFISPTSRVTILAGKMIGTYLIGLLQLIILILATTALGPILGSRGSIWGSNVPGIVFVTLSAIAAATGLGTLIAGVSRTSQQADVLSNAILTGFGVLGGAFFSVASLGPGFQALSKITLNYWATNAFQSLSQGATLNDIAPNIGVLLLIFAITFGIGSVRFSRRFTA